MGSYEETSAALEAYRTTVVGQALEQRNAYDDLKDEFEIYKLAHPDKPVVPPGPASPFIKVDGMKDFYKIDFREAGTTLPAPWTALTGKTNNAAVNRKENLQLIPGEGLVHLMSRETVGGTVYTAAGRAELHVPQFRMLRVGFKADGFGYGSGEWPSVWGRGDDNIGEIDDFEGFSGHMNADSTPKPGSPRITGGGLISTVPDPAVYKLDDKTLDLKIPPAGWNLDHVLETNKVKGSISWALDDRMVGAVGTSQLDGGVVQFDDPKRTWDVRFDLQGPGGKAGDANAGKILHTRTGVIGKWTIRWVQILVPA